MNIASQALALKYRPTNFEELIGQDSVSQTLCLALDANRVSHAYLFSGLRGSGKTSTARIFAKALICDNGPTSTPCGICNNCVMAKESRHMDIIEMDGASNRGIDDIRALIEQTKYKPVMARYKIFIIDEVHMLTPPAFNALLKTLEEPPSYVKFILATTDPLKLPATILSRTQHFRFKHISMQNVAHHLAHILHEENVEYEPEALDILARSGYGSLRDSLTLLDQAIIFSKRFVNVQTVTDMLGLVDPEIITEIFETIFAKDQQKLIQHVKYLQDYEAEMVIDELIAYLKDKMYEQDAKFPTLILDRFFRILSDAKQLLFINADDGFVLTLLFLKMIEAMQIKDIDKMIESLQQEIKIETTPMSKFSKQEKPQILQQRNDIKNPLHLYEKLIAQITDRNVNIGECFTKYIRFVSFENDVLTWESCVDEDCKKALRHGFGVIKQLVREIFGFDVVMKNILCQKDDKNDTSKKIENEDYAQPASMTEEVETENGSCTTNHLNTDKATREFTADNILKEDIVKKSIELFEATKVTIQSKV